jgi:uncharacterized membrane protein
VLQGLYLALIFIYHANLRHSAPRSATLPATAQRLLVVTPKVDTVDSKVATVVAASVVNPVDKLATLAVDSKFSLRN